MKGDPALVEGRVLRYTLQERVIHWLAGFTYVYMLMSGLAFYAPQLYWLASVLGGGPTARFWHPWAGVVFTIVMLWMRQVWREDMRITDADRHWSKEVRKYIENKDAELPPSGRFNAGQKWFYWVTLVSTIFLLLSGLVMWFPEYVPWNLRGFRYAAVFIHEFAALLTIGGFIVHVYMGLFMVPGSLRGIVQGYVSPQWARMHHRLMFDRATSARK